MVLVDTSVWIDVFRDQSGARRKTLSLAVAGEEVALSRFHQLELLQGARDEHEWSLLHSYLEEQHYLELAADSWEKAARIMFDLRSAGRTVRSGVDCCIAQLALDYDILLLHRDRDFEVIAHVRSLRQQRLRW